VTEHRVAVVGAAGQLGRQLVAEFARSTNEVVGLARPAFDITRAADLRRLADLRPDVVVNAAAWTDVDGCARDPERAMAVNGVAAGHVAAAAMAAGALVVQVSTNEVFDGMADRPYREDDPPNPVNPYGASKLAGEQLVVDAGPRHLVVRTAWIFGPGAENFATRIRAAADRAWQHGEALRVVDDEIGNPTPALWLAAAIAELVALSEAGSVAYGHYHLAGWPPVSRYGWARTILGEGRGPVIPVTLAEFARNSTVPPRAILDVSRARAVGIEPGDWASFSAAV
jgi:dTDP-4-dehydrorhamnose reductase